MKSSIRVFGLVLLALIAVNAVAAQSDLPFGQPFEIVQIQSKHVDQKFEITVYVPPHAEGETLPVVYFSDADHYFGIFTEMSRRLATAGLPRAILVGIGYPGNAVTSRHTLLRLRDLLLWSDEFVDRFLDSPVGANLPRDIRKTVPGVFEGAPRFLQFIRDELIPTIEDRYPASPDRTYFGYSAGSLFGFYVLRHEPETFKRYILGSGLTEQTTTWMRELIDSGKRLDVILFFSYGLDEPVEVADAKGERNYIFEDFPKHYATLVSLLEHRANPGLTYSYRAFPDEVHATAWAPAIMFGMRDVFAPGCKPYLTGPSRCPAK